MTSISISTSMISHFAIVFTFRWVTYLFKPTSPPCPHHITPVDRWFARKMRGEEGLNSWKGFSHMAAKKGRLPRILDSFMVFSHWSGEKQGNYTRKGDRIHGRDFYSWQARDGQLSGILYFSRDCRQRCCDVLGIRSLFSEGFKGFFKDISSVFQGSQGSFHVQFSK